MEEKDFQLSKGTDSHPPRKELGGGSALFGLLGYPLGHSFSRTFFNKKFAQEGIDAEYVNFELPSLDTLPRLLDEHPDLRGLNVTLPHKQAVIPYLDELSDEARAIGAVNVIRVSPASSSQQEGKQRFLKGFNSDIIGFMDSIRPLLQPHHRRALVLGTGGASKAICHGLEKLGLEWRYVSRKKEHQASTGVPAEAFTSPFTYSDLTPELLADYTVIVNCTPLGMYPKVDACPDIPYKALTPRHLLYDLVYNPEETLFLRRGREQGAIIKGGLEMLQLQALASWTFWNGNE
ncbi:MAG: shikimate dehydrogenase [Bacteroidaceae bacterium]|nr:shikimate dehydrogenase [Bacteroidaceae bacterium]